MAPNGSQNAMVAAASFARQYYHFLKKDPSQLYKMYSEQSLFSRADESDALDAFSSQAGTDAIHEAIMASAATHVVSKVSFASIKAQDSQDGVIALLTGSIDFVGEDSKRFVQTLFLKAKGDGSYVALNDMVKYMEAPEASYEPEPVKTSQWQAAAAPQQPPVIEPVVPQQPPPSLPVEEPVEEEAEAPEPEPAAVPEVAEAAPEPVGVMAEPAFPEEQPKSWASMATRLKQGGGMLGSSKVQGFSLPPPGTNTRAPPAAKAAAPAAVPAAAPAPEGKKEEAAATSPAAGGSSNVRLWVSRLPADRSFGGKEVIDCLNQLLVGEGLPSGRVTDARVKDGSDWGSVMAVNQEVAEMIVQFSKDRKIVVQGSSLKLELDRGQNPATKSSGKGRGKGKGEKGDSKGEGKGSRKGNKGKGGSGDKAE